MSTTRDVFSGQHPWGLDQADCLAWLREIPSGAVDLTWTDPPFNIGLDYPDYDDRRGRAELLTWLREVLGAVYRVTSPTGALFVAMSPHLVGYLQVMLDAMGWHYRNTIVWHYTFGPAQQHKWTPSHTPILYYTKHPKRFTFNADAIRVPSARMEKYKDKRASPKGKVPDDVWTISRLCGTFLERTGHVCQQPLELVEQGIKACSNEGDLVCDPFAGSGTTLEAAVRLRRRAIGCEVSQATAALARQRMAERVAS